VGIPLVNRPAQLQRGAFAHERAIDAQQILEAALQKDGAEIDGAEPEQQLELLIPDRAIDNPPLQLERHHGERKDQDGQQTEPGLMATAVAPGKGEDAVGPFLGARPVLLGDRHLGHSVFLSPVVRSAPGHKGRPVLTGSACFQPR
jgi:hypothetical protein